MDRATFRMLVRRENWRRPAARAAARTTMGDMLKKWSGCCKWLRGVCCCFLSIDRFENRDFIETRE